MTFYLIPGLGTDDRLFKNLKLEGHRSVCLNWIEPADNESISEYAQRLSSGISPTELFTLIGVSFRGMVAIEMAKILHPERVFVISSVTRRIQLPWYFRAIGRTRGYRLVSGAMIKSIIPFLHLVLGKMTPLELSLISEYAPTNKQSTARMVHQGGTYVEEQASPGDVLQIHGSHDVLFPPRYVGKAFLMGAGMHLMILEKAGIIEQIITSTLPEGQISNLQIASAMRPSGYNVN